MGAAGKQVKMFRPGLEELPEAAFPDGFGIRTMSRDEGPLWLDVQRDSEPWYEVAEDLFEREFGADPEGIEQRCFLLLNPRGAAAGTVSAWYEQDYRGGEWGRIHWLAVRPHYRRRGLARAGLSHALRRMRAWHDRAMLGTQTRRIPAIRLYLQFGFLPDLQPEAAREAWAEVAEQIDHPALAGLAGDP